MKLIEALRKRRMKIPKGWVLLPKELTPEMREAFHKAQEEHERGIGYGPDHQWEAMLAVAPKP